MPWRLARLTADLTDDDAWLGLARGASGGPAENELFHVAAGEHAAQVFDANKILITTAWCSADGSPLAGAGVALDLQPVIVAPLPHATAPGQTSDRLLVGAAVSLAAWAPVLLEVGPVSLATVRVSGADATGVTSRSEDTRLNSSH
mgnify:CR=1 FL=1